ncbi:MAG: hypothetical protein OXL41_05145 [Nitrospinae bacterium]|nr:hypothetical protein [Nitrospinota bacterium]
MDFFSAGQENESAQDAQHRILVEFAITGRTGSIVPIMSQLEGEEQREPLLITSRGVVVNGNRRLAAMRELLLRDSSRFRHFSHVDCAVLPESITPEEILEIEVRLQMRAETRLPYGWIEESIAIREMLRAGKRPAYVADLMKKRPKEVVTAERALTEADIFLKEWVRAPNRYEIIEGAQQAFGDLAKAVEGVEGEILEVKRRFAWALISAEAKQLDGRLYGYNFSFENKTDEVIAALSDRLSIDLTAEPLHEKSNEEIDGIDIDFDDDLDLETSLENLIEAFDDPDPVRRETITSELIEVCKSIRELSRQENVGNQALNAISGANTKLMSADLSKASPETYDAIRAQLTAVKSRTTVLESALLRYTTGVSRTGEIIND